MRRSVLGDAGRKGVTGRQGVTGRCADGKGVLGGVEMSLASLVLREGIW